jgi:hypothetical protein
MGSFADGEVAGFSTTVPNWEKAVGVRSSMGIRIEGAGIEVGILVAGRLETMLRETMVADLRMGGRAWSTGACT